MFYSKDRSESDYSYSLFKDKEKIDDDITNMQGNEEGAFVYIKDGDIYLYNKGKNEKIDDDVSMVLSTNFDVED